ncbi:TonB-dependent receptor [Pseudochelatococcus sp. B33]
MTEFSVEEGALGDDSGGSQGRVVAPLLILSSVFSATAAYGQNAAETSQNGEGENGLALPTVTVVGDQPVNTLQRSTGLARLPTSIQDTPQTINVISREVIEERGLASLSDIVTQVPGITMSAGEGGGGGQRGDNFNIRGFSAQGNIFTDGIRDIGIYNRDAFNLEQVEVLKGPSGSTLGRGGGGGSINLETKRPKPYSFVEFNGTIGTDSYYRGTVDANYAVNDEIAVRLNVLGFDREFAKRDHADLTRWGIAPSFTFGLNSDTKISIDYLHQSEDGRPDNGVPRFGVSIAQGGDGIARPVTKLGVRQANYYGYTNDFEDMVADVGTLRIEHRFNDNFDILNVSRIGRYDLDRFVTVMQPSTLYSPLNCPALTASCVSTNHVRQSRGQVAHTYQNQTTLNAKFETGPFKHQAVIGVDFSREVYDQFAYNVSTPNPPTLLNVHFPAFAFAPQTRTRSRTDNHVVDTAGISVYDRIELGHGFFVVGSGRFEDYSIDSESRNGAGTVTGVYKGSDRLFSWQAALEYKPAENQTYYISAGTAELPASPSTGYQSVTSTSGIASDPERTTSIEAGAKFSLLDDRLGLGAAIFHIERTNANDYDSATGEFIKRDDTRIARGIELQATGRITDKWSINAGYAYIDTEIEKPGDPTDGQEMALTPKHSGFIWTTYQITDAILVGGGATYVGERWTSDFNPSLTAVNGQLPSHWQFDAVARWKVHEHFELQFNAQNIFNEKVFLRSHGARHMVQAPGRTFLLTAKATF